MSYETKIIHHVKGGSKGEQSYDEKNYESGIIRAPYKDGYKYFYVKNKKQVSKDDLERIKSLKIPPAWNNVWVSGKKYSDIQAVGVDSKGRKQYKYNEKHAIEAEKKKFSRLYNFIKDTPKLNKILQKHIQLPVYNKNKVIATMLILVKKLHFRVGKEQYAKENKSYGISSLKKSHVKFDKDLIKFDFKGKSNQRLHYSLRSNEIKTHLQMLLKLEGDKLFQYIDDDDKIKRVTDTDLNQYIQKYMGKEFTIKDFRTYGANYHFIQALLHEIKKHSDNIKKNILNAIKTTAKFLKHTKNISKKSYIMSYTIDLYTKNPEFFISRKFDDPLSVLLDVLKLYRKNVLHIH
jgi:DNA topoisomerase-1